MPSCYILYSKKIQTYYVGFTTESILIRLSRHNEGYYENTWTARGVPWEIFLDIQCEKEAQERRIEAHIKKMKSKKYIENLKQYPELLEKLKERYSMPDC